MRLPTLRRNRASGSRSGITGAARLDRRTKRLTGRLKPGDIAIIDHVDIDRVAGDALVATGISAVINASPSVSGRYPNLGPEAILKAGIPLIDNAGAQIFEAIHEGQDIRIDGDTIYLADEPVGKGLRYTAESLAEAMTSRSHGPGYSAGGLRREHDGIRQAGAGTAA